MSSHAQDLASPGVGGVAAFAPPEEFDDFVVLRRLGQGATGQVYLAEDPSWPDRSRSSSSGPTGSRGRASGS